jgi:type II secretory pathway component GspD/PulD (secretin)
MKLNGRCLTSKGNSKQYSAALRKMTSKVLFKYGKNDGVAAYILKENILKGMVVKLSKVSQHSFFGLVRELSDSLDLYLHVPCMPSWHCV